MRVRQNFKNNWVLHHDDVPGHMNWRTRRISFDTAYSALETSLQVFLKEQTDVTSRELMVVHKWPKFAEKQRFSEPKQKVLTEFFPKK